MTTQHTAPRSIAELGAGREEACERLGIHTDTLRRYVRAGLLDAVKVGPQKVVITWASIERLLSER